MDGEIHPSGFVQQGGDSASLVTTYAAQRPRMEFSIHTRNTWNILIVIHGYRTRTYSHSCRGKSCNTDYFKKYWNSPRIIWHYIDQPSSPTDVLGPTPKAGQYHGAWCEILYFLYYAQHCFEFKKASETEPFSHCTKQCRIISILLIVVSHTVRDAVVIRISGNTAKQRPELLHVIKSHTILSGKIIIRKYLHIVHVYHKQPQMCINIVHKMISTAICPLPFYWRETAVTYDKSVYKPDIVAYSKSRVSLKSVSRLNYRHYACM